MRLARLSTALAFAVVLGVPAIGLGREKDKGKSKDETTTAERQDYSDKDRKTLAEIAQRPEVQKEIEWAWQVQRRKDIQEAFDTNTNKDGLVTIYPNPLHPRPRDRTRRARAHVPAGAQPNP